MWSRHGSARQVEKALGVEGDDILYVGDHICAPFKTSSYTFKNGSDCRVLGLGFNFCCSCDNRAQSCLWLHAM